MDVEASVDLGRFEAAVKVVDVHAAGEPCRVAVGGAADAEGRPPVRDGRRCHPAGPVPFSNPSDHASASSSQLGRSSL